MKREIVGALVCAALTFGATAGAQQAPAVAEGATKSSKLVTPEELNPNAAQPTPAETEPDPRELLSMPLDVFGYVKLGYFFITSPNEDALIGSNNGFRLINARVGVSLKPAENLEAVVSIDGALTQRRETDPLVGERIVALRDAYLEWRPSRFAQLRGGQFKAPFNAEVLLPDDSLPFITRSVVSEGILPPEGFTRAGLALDRQVGVQLSSDRIGGDVGFQYALAVVNGNGPNVLNNDNNHVAPMARAVVSYRDLVSLGLNGYQNTVSLGDRPRVTEAHLTYGADLSVNVAGLNVFAMYLMRNISHEDTGLPDEQASGLVASARYLYEPIGVEVGARYARYAPSDAQLNDELSEVTAMVGYRLKRIPARILAQYTLRMEEQAVAVGNDSIDVMAQVTF